MVFYFYSQIDKNKEPIGKCVAPSFEKAAIHFAQIKQLDLESFLRLYYVSH